MSIVHSLSQFMQTQSAEYVGSYLEFYTTLYGLSAGEQFFGLMWALGLWKLVFATVVVAVGIEGWRMGGVDGADYIVRTLWWRMLGTYFVMLLFVWPISRLNIATMAYQPPPTFSTVTQAGQSYTAESAQDVQWHGRRGFRAGSDLNVRVPLGIRLAMMVGHGFNRAATKILPDQLSLRLLDQGLANLKLEDASLRSSLVKFNLQCYIPAVNKWQTFWAGRQKPSSLVQAEATWGIDDLGYMGSKVLMETPGLYQPCTVPNRCGSSLQASEPVQGFPYSPIRDGTSLVASTVETVGRPYCNEWWLKLRDDIFNSTEGYAQSFQTILTRNNITAPLLADSDNEYSLPDVIAKLVLARNNVDSLFSDDLSYYTGKIKSDTGVGATVAKSVSKGATEFVSWAGNIVSQPFASAENLTNNNLQQITQSIVLLALYILAPFVALFSGFNFRVLATYAILVLSVICWQLWWTITMWVDSNLLMSMYPDAGSVTGMLEEFGSKRMLLDRTTNAMAIFAPSVWSFVLGVAGWQGAGALSGLTSPMQQQAQKIAKDVAQQGLQAVQKLMNLIPGAGGAIASQLSSAFTRSGGKSLPTAGRKA